MPVRVLIVEDSSTGSLLSEYLSTQLARLSGADVDPNGYVYEEPGDLAHVVPSAWDAPYDNEHFEVRPLRTDAIKTIIEVSANEPLTRLQEEVSAQFASLFPTSTRAMPDVLIVDLALSRSETRELIAQGGNQLVEPKPAFDPSVDPREQLLELTGFRVLQACGAESPVIATSYARNPLVARCCLINGAHAFVQKPVTDKVGEGEVPPAPKGFDLATARKMGIPKLEHAANQNEDPLAVAVMTYLTVAAVEVLKAVHIVGLARADRELPKGFVRSLTLG